ncbi:MAG TPA: glycosyltransferase [Patescibacteria group bacterium]|nr:glycosyltransferase [Patescibacteria group bacterium]
MKVALVYDRVNKWGGAERVLLALHELFPQAPLYTSVYSAKKAGWADVFVVKPSFLQRIPFAKTAHEWFALLMPCVFESFTFAEYDLVISVTSEAAKGILTMPSTLHICYCLTPTRYLWSGHNDYFPSFLLSRLASLAVAYLRTWDKVASFRPDFFIAISEEVRTRIKNYYGRDSVVIHPPVDLFASQPVKKNKGEYYLIVARLVPYKRVDLAIKACTRLGLPLKVVGIGSEFKRLRKIAGPTVEFLGAVSDEELINLYQHATALLFPGLEDFGIVMVEALGFGKPVIAFGKGGALDIVEDGVTGVLFPTQTIKDMIEAIQKSQTISFQPSILRRKAEFFAKEQFKHRLSTYIAEICKSRK